MDQLLTRTAESNSGTEERSEIVPNGTGVVYRRLVLARYLVAVWIPTDAQELREAACAGRLAETPTFDAKASLPTETGTSISSRRPPQPFDEINVSYLPVQHPASSPAKNLASSGYRVFMKKITKTMPWLFSADRVIMQKLNGYGGVG
jgi:hypothetical protein